MLYTFKTFVSLLSGHASYYNTSLVIRTIWRRCGLGYPGIRISEGKHRTVCNIKSSPAAKA